MQGSSIASSLYIVEAADLNTVTTGKMLSKYIIPASNSHTRNTEIDHIFESWTKANNLTLNRSKQKKQT